jgi:hypothetical protein
LNEEKPALGGLNGREARRSEMNYTNRLLAPTLYVLHPDGSHSEATAMEIALKVVEIIASTRDVAASALVRDDQPELEIDRHSWVTADGSPCPPTACG